MKTIQSKNPEELFSQAADEIALHLLPNSVIALCGGRSVVGLLKAFNGKLSSSEIFIVDERVVPITSLDSNFKLVSEALAESVDEKRLHPFLNEDISGYKTELDRFGGKFDVVVLGVGEDGHIAALFPGHPKLRDESEGFVILTDSPKPPPVRMTASRKLVERSNLAVLLFIGEAKREAYERFIDPEMTVEDCPAKIALSCKECLVVTDLL
jgi:6-phosphogluconolactonase